MNKRPLSLSSFLFIPHPSSLLFRFPFLCDNLLPLHSCNPTNRTIAVEDRFMNAVKIFCTLALLTALISLPLRAQQPAGQSFSPPADPAPSVPDGVGGASK